MPVLFIVAIVCCTIDHDDPRGGNVRAWAPVFIALSPLLLRGTGMARNRLSFAGWALFHPATVFGEPDRDDIIRGWDSWGFGGLENDSYLVADPRDAIDTLPAAEAWRKRHGQSGEIVDTQRMAPRRYIVTTYNCPLEGSYPT